MGSMRASAWGQAAFQEGGDVRSLPYKYMGLPLDVHLGLGHAGLPLLQVPWSRQQGRPSSGSRLRRLVSYPLPPLLPRTLDINSCNLLCNRYQIEPCERSVASNREIHLHPYIWYSEPGHHPSTPQFSPFFSPNSYNSTGDNTMPSVKPREWDAMSAKEQLLWYLERLCAQADEMCSALGIARVGDPPVVTSLVDLAVSTTTDASPAPVPDVPSSTTKSTEVLEVICDASTACIVRAPINCSVDGSTQVSTVVSLNEIQDATTTVHPEPMVDLIHQEVAVEIVTLVPTTNNVSPKTSVQERDDSPLPSIQWITARNGGGSSLFHFISFVYPDSCNSYCD